MAFELDRNHGFPGIAASNIAPNTAVTLAPGAGDRAVMPVATSGDEPFGVVRATALRTEGITVHEESAVIKMRAAASLGMGARVAHATSNGAVGPVAAASGVAAWQIGRAMNPAAAGEFVSVYVKPRQLGGIA